MGKLTRPSTGWPGRRRSGRTTLGQGRLPSVARGRSLIAGDIHWQSANADIGFLARFRSNGEQDTGFSDDGLYLDVFATARLQPGGPYRKQLRHGGGCRRMEPCGRRGRGRSQSRVAVAGSGRTKSRTLRSTAPAARRRGLSTHTAACRGPSPWAKRTASSPWWATPMGPLPSLGRDNGTRDPSFSADGLVTTGVSADDELPRRRSGHRRPWTDRRRRRLDNSSRIGQMRPGTLFR